MTGRAHARALLTEVPAPPSASVAVGFGEAVAAGPVLRLVQRRCATESIARVTRRSAGDVVLALELPGIGARYLRSVAESATSSGWTADETAGLLVELQARCTYWLAAPHPERAVATAMRRAPRLGSSAVAWSAAGWAPSDASSRALRGVVAEALDRDAIVVVASSGGPPPRGLTRELAALGTAGVEVGSLREGIARHSGGRWAVEALGAPRLDGNFGALREQFAAAPRCGWCGLPVVGRRCRRCCPGAER